VKRRRTARNSGSVGTTRKKLAKLLEAYGFEIMTGDLIPVQGVYRNSPYHDVQRWNGWGKAKGHATLNDGIEVSFGSWDTMTECVRHGIEVDQDYRDTATHFEISAKGQ
jgi:hypothetical protein